MAEGQLDESETIRHAQEWLNEHGQPSYEYLRRLAGSDSAASRDRLLEIADQYNIPYEHSTSLDELVERIRLRMNLGPESS